MSLLGMPLTVINLGGEMMYILEQRLIAQNIPQEKAVKVITDIVRTMFNPKFVDELFKPQELYSSTSTRQIFDRIAHSSIMRLSESSMDKLYDLMTTGFKYQIISCKTGQEIVDVTLNHLNSIHSMVGGNAKDLVAECTRKVQQVYLSLSGGSLALVRHTMMRNMQDRKVKVSPFLLDGIQNTDGSMVLVPCGMLPPLFQVPGQVRFIVEGATGDTGATGHTVQVVHYPLPLSGVCEVYNGAAQSNLGLNLYLKSQAREKVAESSGSTVQPPLPPMARPARASTASAELNLLGSLLDMPAAKQSAEEFKLSIFDESRTAAANASAAGGGGGGGGGGGDGGMVETIFFDQPQGRSGTLAQLAAQLEDKSTPPPGEDQDDLLALMDSAL